MMSVGDYVRYFLKEGIYVIVATIYLILLHRLNKDLLMLNFDNPFDLLVYKDWAPIHYFVIALILELIGVFLIIDRIKKLLQSEFQLYEVVLAIVSIAVVIAIFVLIIIFIQNPILRAIFTVIAIIFGGTYLYTR